MPTYTYECKKCGHTQIKFHQMSATPKVKCEECSGACKRLIGTGSGIIFKGSGFYETDYKSKSGKPADSGTPTESNGKSNGKSGDSGKKSESTPSKKTSATTSE